MSKTCDSKLEAAKGLIKEYRDLIEKSKVIGIGTGTTVTNVIEELSNLGLLQDKLVVPSSLDTALKLKNVGAKVLMPSTISSLELYIDGADEVDEKGNLVKGGGAALLGEKILASISKYNIIVVDESKIVRSIGEKPIPIEVVPWALSYVISRLEKIGLRPKVRSNVKGKMGPIVSDWCGIIVDVYVNDKVRPKVLEETLKSIPGVVEVGIFVGLTDTVIVGLRSCGYRVLKFKRILK